VSERLLAGRRWGPVILTVIVATTVVTTKPPISEGREFITKKEIT
jgi:hypothetical protein